MARVGRCEESRLELLCLLTSSSAGTNSSSEASEEGRSSASARSSAKIAWIRGICEPNRGECTGDVPLASQDLDACLAAYLAARVSDELFYAIVPLAIKPCAFDDGPKLGGRSDGGSGVKPFVR